MPMPGPAGRVRLARCLVRWDVTDARWGDVPGMVNIVAAAAADGFFSPAYLDVRYQVGLALQLFSVLVRGKMAVPGQAATPAGLRVVREGRDVLGFSLVRRLPHPAPAHHLELHLLAVRADARRAGVGQALIQDSVTHLADGQCLLLSTLARADGMRRLVRRMGAKTLGAVPPSRPGQQPLTAHVFDPAGRNVWEDQPWRAWLAGTQA